MTSSCDVEPTVLEPRASAVGLDVGLTSFATLSTGEKIGNPHFLRCTERRLRRAQRRREKAPMGSILRRKRRKIEAHVHERIAHRRSNFAHQEARKVVDAHGIICVEHLAINQMVYNHCLAKSIHDAAWRQFLTLLAYKAACAGRQLVQVNAAYTTRDCSNPTCGHRQDLSLSERVYLCPCCGLQIDRNLNAARNILRLGLQSLAQA